MTRTIDFDAFRAEQSAEPVTLKIGGEVYSLAPDMPAEVALEVIDFRAREGDNAQIPADRITSIAQKLFGKDVFEALLTKHRLTTGELAMLVVQVFEQYNTATVPNRRAPRRSGRSRTKPSNST